MQKSKITSVVTGLMALTMTMAAPGILAQTKSETPAQPEQKQEQDKPGERAGEQAERAQEQAGRAQEEAGRAKEQARHAREQGDHLYERAGHALDKRQWEEASALYEQIIKTGGDRVEGAYYWQAYAAHKQGQKDKALAALAELEKSHPQSRWISDAKKLEVEIQQAGGQPVNAENQPDEELKLLALDGLMRADPARGLPLLQKLLESSQSRKVREQSLFVLSQSDAPKAREILAGFAQGKANPDLQLKALEYLALSGGDENRKLLASIYASSDDKRTKRAILGFFMMAGDREKLLAAAKDEKDPDLRREAIGQLGAMGASEDLSKLYGGETDAGLKKKIMEAMFMGGNAVKLSELALNEKDPALRLKAVELLGPMGAEKTGPTLVFLYEKDKDLRRKIIEALFVQGNAKALVAIARRETDPRLKKKAVEQLSVMNSKEGSEFFMELLSK